MVPMVLFAATAATLLTALYQIFALPAGIRLIVNDDISRKLLLCVNGAGLLMYAGWSIYGVVQKDLVITLGCGIGATSASILVGYTLWLRRSN